MKFANIVYKTRGNRITIGDDIQLLAIENMYQYMGIPAEDVVRIDYGELATYDGEHLILPLSFPLLSYTKDALITCFSDRIIPVFLGVCMIADSFEAEDIEYMKKYGPVGCRDLYTYTNLKANGIPSYLNGCMTLTLPLRAEAGKGKKVICIDVPDHLCRIIPDDLIKNAEFFSHIYYTDELDCTPEEKAREMYSYYINQGRLIITTRLHAALPCMAAGLPVVFLKDEFSYRFAGIDAVVPVYSANNYNQINWDPTPVNLESHKKEVLELASRRLWDAYARFAPMCDLSRRLEDRDRGDYYVESLDNTKEFLLSNWDTQDSVEYVLWGATQVASCIHRFISEQFPKARLVGIVDRSKRIEFCGVKTKPKGEVPFDKNTWYIVCAYAAIGEAQDWFSDNGIVRYYQTGDDVYTHHLFDDIKQEGLAK